jgi:transcription termination factor NusB
MKIRKITISYSNTKDKLDLDNDNKSITILKDFTSNYQDKLDEKKEELDDNVKEYTKDKINSDIDKVNKCILKLEDFIENHHYILNWKKNELIGQELLLDKLNNLKRFN